MNMLQILQYKPVFCLSSYPSECEGSPVPSTCANQKLPSTLYSFTFCIKERTTQQHKDIVVSVHSSVFFVFVELIVLVFVLSFHDVSEYSTL